MTNTSIIYNKCVFVDTSALYALFNASDTDHQTAVTCMSELIHNRRSFIISNFIIDEIYTLLLTKSGRSVALSVVEYLLKEWIIERVSLDDEDNTLTILRMSTDKTYSYTDVTSFVLMDRLGLNSVFSFDKHFVQYGLNVYPQ